MTIALVGSPLWCCFMSQNRVPPLPLVSRAVCCESHVIARQSLLSTRLADRVLKWQQCKQEHMECSAALGSLVIFESMLGQVGYLCLAIWSSAETLPIQLDLKANTLKRNSICMGWLVFKSHTPMCAQIGWLQDDKLLQTRPCPQGVNEYILNAC